MRTFRGLIIAILILMLGMGVFAVGAQDDLLTNTPAAEATVEPVVTPAPVVDVPVDPPGTLAGLLNFVMGALVGAIVTLTSTFAIIGRLKDNKPLLDLIEQLGKSVPADVTLKLNELGQQVRDAGEVIVDVTDGLPNAVNG